MVRAFASLFHGYNTPRLEPQGSGKMCHYIVKLTDAAQVDDEVKAWLRAAYTAAG
ncbi:hypothetical protein NOG12_05990 [Pseudidiomarina sp. GXY010]|uniref:DUF5655 domain-containing protein n=1 Tax=Pseudidiomarina fusca TaxID=2965078 RepID=A0ABU3KXJ3_9GAMM|nr:hypothetical protein [Pseudidiomarina sp. GXY010]MDT7525616.1 hypothetical protein [Pseudidiomarina sp. GXY010]